MKIKYNKKQLMAAGVMLVISALPIAVAYQYAAGPVAAPISNYKSSEVLRQLSEAELPATVPVPETEAAVEEWVPTPGYLNQSRLFPEGADTSKVEASYAGSTFGVLMDMDADWLDNIYDNADRTPSQMARQLRRPVGSVTGKYNPKDSRHNPDNPSTWTINSFKRIQMNITNGDGQVVSAYSNVIDIMAMANLYTYFNGIEDHELFLSYAEKLWKDSHSYSVGMSKIYYCAGCLSDEDERRELEAEVLAEAQGAPVPATEAATDQVAEEPASDTAETTEASSVIEAGKTNLKQSTTAATETAATEPESSSGVIISGQPQTAAPEDSNGDLGTAAENSAEGTNGSLAAIAQAAAEAFVPNSGAATDPSVAADMASASNAAGNATADKKKAAQTPAYKCPGHVDLIINAKILGLKEQKGLLAKDSIGNDPAGFTEDGWQGWNNYNIASVRLHSEQDWYEKYGLTVSMFSMKNPLSESEIEEYINRVSQDLSPERRELIHFALSSVGKVPYYWGGKPNSPNYQGNSFGVMVSPDYKGRVLKGLDCSGWISWVYWSTTGNRLTYEGTSGLALEGKRISRSELKPGDIIIRTGTDAHVIMFLGWTDDGRILCVHESSGKTNNVTVAVRDANWPYYRSLIDE